MPISYFIKSLQVTFWPTSRVATAYKYCDPQTCSRVYFTKWLT
jgi:hypothetical protein